MNNLSIVVSNSVMYLMILDVSDILKRNHGNRFIFHIKLNLSIN